MKGIEMFCSSHASTAICLSIDKNSTVRHGGPDRQSKHTTTKSSSRSPSSRELHDHKPRRSVQLGNPSVSSCCQLGEFISSVGRNKHISSSCKDIQVDRHKRGSEKKSSSSSSWYQLSDTNFSKQVVVLKVSIHCKGCEMKVRKHISRMEGVSSFSIDLETKKVTIVGDVSPLGVLRSVSRVKNAQFWSSATPASGSAPANF